MDETMMGRPSFTSRIFPLKLDQVAPSMLTQLTKRPVGRARLNGTPSQDKAGMRITAEPTPPRAKMKLRPNDRKAMIRIWDSIWYRNLQTNVDVRIQASLNSGPGKKIKPKYALL